MKMKVQAQHLQAGDVVGSGQTVEYVITNSINFASNKVMVVFKGVGKIWGKYTIINIDRPE